MILKLLLPILIFCLGLTSTVWAQSFPEYQDGVAITDVTGKLPLSYISQIDAQVRAYPFPVKVVYLPETQDINLGHYASRLFTHWELPEDHLLVVVALDRRKIGIHAGQQVKAQLKNQSDQDQELPIPSPSAPIPGVTADPTLQPDTSSEFDHLELIPQAIEQISQSIGKSEPSTANASESPGLSVESNLSEVQPEAQRNRQLMALSQSEWLWILAVIALFVLGIAAWFGFKLWRRWNKNREFVDRYSLEGQVVYEQLEQVYESIEAVMPDFHGYLGETEKTLGLFVKSMHGVQEDYEYIFDHFEKETRHLAQKDTKEEALDFFRDLELKLEEGKQLYEQALNVLKNLKDVRQSNQQLFEQSDQKRQAFSQELNEMRKLNSRLQLSKIQQMYQTLILELKRFEKRNERDPLGVEKDLKAWRKKLSRLEQDTRSLPHLWQQFSQDLKTRVQDLKKRIQQQNSTGLNSQIQEVERLHHTLVQAIEQGDLSQLNRWNERFTQKLQELETKI